MKRTNRYLLLPVSLVLLLSSPGLAQTGSPLPGGAGSPTPGAAPLPGPPTQQVLGGGPNANYRRLPLNYQTASIRLEELRNIMITAKPKEFQDAITDYLDWLGDMADGHWKIYQAFSKVESMKAQADVEKQTTLKLGGLKRQAMLLKAEFLIRNNRQPEALQPLIDIVAAEPKTATGEAAYSLLKQIGFSEEIPLSPSANAPGPSGAVSTAKPIANASGTAPAAQASAGKPAAVSALTPATPSSTVPSKTIAPAQSRSVASSGQIH